MAAIADLEHVTVWRDPTGRWNAAFPQIACLSDGTLVVAFREAPFPATLAGENLTHGHGDPLARGAIIRSVDGGRTWDPASRRLLAEPLGGVEQISISVISGDLLLAPYARLRRRQTQTDPPSWLGVGGTDVWLRRSSDGGNTWDEPVPLHTAPLAWAPVHAPMLELPDGLLLSPHCGSIGLSPDNLKQHGQAVIRSADRGRTWGNGSIIALDPSGARHYHQCSLARLDDGEIIAAMHSAERPTTPDGQQPFFHRLWLARSRDDGHTWSALEELPLQISGAAHHLLRLRDGRLLCTWGNRFDPSIRAAVSDDRGQSWDTTRGWPLREGEHLAQFGQRPFVRRSDGGIVTLPYTDIGETCSTHLPDGRIITVYYWAHGNDDPLRYIEAASYRLAP